ncbi:hypothetical protein [Streptomyces sp. LN549]
MNPESSRPGITDHHCTRTDVARAGASVADMATGATSSGCS